MRYNSPVPQSGDDTHAAENRHYSIMFGLGTTEIVIILVLALLLFGPQKLPEIGKQIGGMLREFRNMSGDVQRALDLDSHNDYDNRYTQHSTYDYGYKGESHYASLPNETPEEEKVIAPFAYSAPTTGMPIAANASASDISDTVATNDPLVTGDTVEEAVQEVSETAAPGAARVYNEPEASDPAKVAHDATAKEEKTI